MNDAKLKSAITQALSSELWVIHNKLEGVQKVCSAERTYGRITKTDEEVFFRVDNEAHRIEDVFFSETAAKTALESRLRTAAQALTDRADLLKAQLGGA